MNYVMRQKENISKNTADHHSEPKRMQMSNEEFLPFVVEQLQSHPHKTVTLPLRGRSMRPFLEDNRDKALLQYSAQYHVGDVVLAEIAPGHFVLHRVIAINADKVTLRGDGNLGIEQCRMADLRALAIGFFRKGRTKADLTSGPKWKIYSAVWTRLFPIRRYLLFALHPHLPSCLKRK